MTISAAKTVKYSQNDEEPLILARVGTLKSGVVMDIGAHDGRTNSNSLALIEMGWRALLVEPSPFAFAELLKLHASNERVTLLNAAIGMDNRIVRFHDFGGDQYSTTDPEKAARHLPDAKAEMRSYWVPQVTIPTVMAQLGGSADVLSIDTEGTAFDILSSCPVGSWDTKAIILEHDGRIVEISGWARERGFRVHEVNAENVVLFRE